MKQKIKRNTKNLIDMSTFSAGNYMVSVILENGLISTRKIVKL